MVSHLSGQLRTFPRGNCSELKWLKERDLQYHRSRNRSMPSGFQEEGYNEMIGFQGKRDPRRQMGRGVGAMYSLTRGMSMEEGLGRE